MSSIYEKLPASGEKCLILEPKEALFYPFDFGSGWSEIRLGTINSFTNLTENGLFSNESIVTTSPSNNFYYGFIYSPNNELPFTKDTISFVRAAQTGTANTVAVNPSIVSNITSSAGERFFTSGNTVRASAFSTDVVLMGSTTANATGSGAFAGANQCSLRIDRANKSFIFRDNAATSLVTYPSNNTTTSQLRASMAAFTFAQSITGYYTVDGTSGTDILPLPNKAIIYSPFLNSRLRIHNLVVERYA